MVTRRANKTSEDTVHPSGSNRYTKFNNSSAIDQSHKNISSEGLRARNFANIYKRVRKVRPKKQNTTLLVSENRKEGSRPLYRKHLQRHRLLRKQNINAQNEESNEERKNQFVETEVRTVPKESDDEDVYYELYEHPTNDTAEGEKHFGVHRIFYTERHFGKNQNGKAGVSLIEQENAERISSEEKSVNKKYKKLNVNSQIQNGEVTTNITKDYDFSYHTIYEHFDPYIDKQNAESSVFENEPFALGSTVHHTDIKEGGDAKDKILDTTQKFYKGFKYDDFDHHNTSEKNKTHNDETKRMFLQLIRRTLLPAASSSSPKLKERTEQQEKPIEPGKLSFRSQLRFGNIKDANKLNNMVSRRANETSEGTAHQSSSIRFREIEQSTGRNMAENESFVLSSSVQHTDIKEGHDVKDKIFGTTLKFYKDFKYDDFHQRNTSEKNKTRDDGTKRMFIQLMRRTLSPAASSSSLELKERTEHQEPRKLRFRSQLRFGNINDTNKLNSMVTRRANETSEDTVHPSGSSRFTKFDKQNAPNNKLSRNSSQHLTSGTTNEEKNSDKSLLHTIDPSVEEIISNSKNSSKEVVLQESMSSSTVSTNALFIQFGLQNITTTTNPSVIGEKPASSEIVFSSMSLPLSYKSTTEPEIIAKMELACSGKEIVFFPDYESGCKKFHVCFHDIKESYNCPGAMLFNPETKTCDFPNNVVCHTPRIEEKFVCRNKVTGYHPNYKSGCRTYYECLNGKAFHYSCSTGKLFNTKTVACELAENVSCVDPGKQSTVSDLIKKKHIPDHVHGIPHQFVFDCTNKPNGFYPDYARFCHVFYKCENGIKTSHHCKQGYLFNSDLRTCDFEENVNCNSISHEHSTKIKDVNYDD
ncbi:uncharacterized protein LOC143256617 [Tachypleus tridentatus]|uniref:uncharacterized protein LOC143256617 n=1 Tax=Tachypleus tridentatus TaxID=6853 RepID=UPI003FD47337